jgi:hypothetical protein
VVFVNTFTLSGAGTYPPGVYVVETMEARLAKPGVHSPNSIMAIMLPTSNLSTLRVEAEASELEAALARGSRGRRNQDLSCGLSGRVRTRPQIAGLVAAPIDNL